MKKWSDIKKKKSIADFGKGVPMSVVVAMEESRTHQTVYTADELAYYGHKLTSKDYRDYVALCQTELHLTLKRRK